MAASNIQFDSPIFFCNDCEHLEVTGCHLLDRGCIIISCV